METILRLWPGLVFIIAGFAKLKSGSSFLMSESYVLLPGYIQNFGNYLLPWLEICAGLWLISGYFRKAALAAVMIFSLAFLGVNIYGITAGDGSSCGCFGKLFLLSHWQALILDCLMMVTIIVLMSFKKQLSNLRVRQLNLQYLKTAFSLLSVLSIVLSFNPVIISASSETEIRSYPIMKPDRDQLRNWIADYENAPSTFTVNSLFKNSSIPDSYSLLPYFPYDPVERDQGWAGNCWVWAGTGLMEIDHAVRDSIYDRLSIQYFDSNYREGKGDWAGCGGDLSEFAAFYNSYAESQLITIPWSNTNAHYADIDTQCEDGSSSTASEMIDNIPFYRLSGSIQDMTIQTVDVSQSEAIANIKNTLLQNKAVFLGFYANGDQWRDFCNFWRYQDETGIWDPDYTDGEIFDYSGGGHAVLCVGYSVEDPDNPYWLLLNSWGTTDQRPNGLFRLDMNLDYSCRFIENDESFASFQWQTLDDVFSDGSDSTPSIILSDTVAITGQEITVSGLNFSADEDDIHVLFDGSTILSGITSDSTGQWSASFTVPDVVSGDYCISAYGPVTDLEEVSEAILSVKLSAGIISPDEVYSGQIFQAVVSVGKTPGLDFYQFEIGFDTDLIEIINDEGGSGVSPGMIGSTTVPVDFWYYISEARDKIRVAGDLLGDEGVYGDGSLVTVSFTVTGAIGQSCELSLSNALFLDYEGKQIKTVLNNGFVSIVEPATPTLVNILPGSDIAYAGETLPVEIKISDVTDLNTYQFDLSFNENAMQIAGEEGGVGVRKGIIEGTDIQIDNWGFVPYGSPGGKVRVMGRIPNNIGASGTGSLATIDFVILDNGYCSSDLVLSNLRLFDPEMNIILTGAASGLVDVVPQLEIITPSQLEAAEVNLFYSQTLEAAGGVEPYYWSSEGELPAGFTLEESGRLSGFPSAAGTDNEICVRVTDDRGRTADRSLTISIYSAPSIISSSLPPAEKGIPYSYFLTAEGGVAPYTWNIEEGILPSGLTLDAETGQISGVPAEIYPETMITFKLTDAMGGITIDGLPMTVAAEPSITGPSQLLPGKVGISYSCILSVDGGIAPYQWSIEDGSLPAGLMLDSETGEIYGSPVEEYYEQEVRVAVTDSLGGKANIILRISVVEVLIIVSESPLPPGQTWLEYEYTLISEGGVLPVAWSIEAGSLPQGLLLDPDTGLISGIPEAVFPEADITFRLTDSVGDYILKDLSIYVVDSLAIDANTDLPAAEVGIPYEFHLMAQGGVPPYLWDIEEGVLPPGLSLEESTGKISGLPAEVYAEARIVVGVTDTAGTTAARGVAIYVVAGPEITTVSPLGPGEVGLNYAAGLTVEGGLAPFTWEVENGSLPEGLVLDSETGQIAGFPTSAHPATEIGFKVTDSLGGTSTKSLGLMIADKLQIISTDLDPAEAGLNYGFNLECSGGIAPYIWQIQDGALPAGLALDSHTGLISGIPTGVVAETQIQIVVTDSLLASASKSFSIRVEDTPQIQDPAILPDAILGVNYSFAFSGVNGIPPYSWKIESGTLPDGLSFSESEGIVSGVPSVAGGPYYFSVSLTDSPGGKTSTEFAITVRQALVISTATTLDAGVAGQGYSTDLSVDGGLEPYTWTVSSGILPPGLSLDSSGGAIVGTPQTAGNYSLTLIVEDSSNPPLSTTQSFSLKIYLKGDVNLDDKVNVGDIAVIQLIILEIWPPTLAADVNLDGMINIGDLVKIERIMLRIDFNR